MIKDLLAKMGLANPRNGPGSGLTKADARALAEYASECDDLEAGLGKAVAAYVLSGEGDSLLLRLRALPHHEARLSGPLPAQVWIYGGPNGTELDQAATARNAPRILARRRVLLALEGWDAAAIQRLGAVLAELNGSGTGMAQHYPGTAAAPAWFRALVEAVHACHRNHHGHDGQGFGMLDAARCLEMLRLEGAAADALVDVCFGSSDYYSRQ